MIRQTMHNRAASRHGYGAQRGFTLIEMMIVVAIISVLTVIAFGSYNWATTKTRRKEAESCIEQGAQFMERFYATNLRYDKDVTGTTAVALPAQCAADLNPYYTVALSTGAALTTTAYTITATPVSGSSQASRDTTCKVLAMDQTGKKMYNTSTVESGSICW